MSTGIPPQMLLRAMQVLWYNLHIKIQGKPFYFKKAHQAGVLLLCNIWNIKSGKFFTYDQIKTIYGEQAITFLEYYGIQSATPQHWLVQLRNTRQIMEDFQFPYENLKGKIIKKIYENLISKKEPLIQLKEKWNGKLNEGITWEELSGCFLDINHLVIDTKMRNFQFRFLHWNIYCAKMLHSWGIAESPICFYCNTEYETLEHLFYRCTVTTRFWEQFQAWYECATDTEIQITENIVMFANSQESKLLNSLIIMAKHFIFSRHIQEKPLNVYILKDRIMETVKIERYHALKYKKYKPFIKNWEILF